MSVFRAATCSSLKFFSMKLPSRPAIFTTFLQLGDLDDVSEL